MQSTYRDHPQPSMDMQNYYDAPQHAAQSPFEDVGVVGSNAGHGGGGPIYSQAATYSTTDVMNPSRVQYTEPTYQPSNAWLEKTGSSKKRSKWIVIGSLVALLGLIAIGVAVGVAVSRNNSKSSSSSTSSGNSAVPQTNPNDPSTFIKDPRLHQSFYGLAYTPAGSQLPTCTNKLSDVIQDIQLMSQLTKRIRLYGADCNQSALVLEAIKQTKVNMTVYLGNYAIATDNGTAYQRQRGEIQSALQTYGTNNVGGLTVGNEFMLNYLNANGGSDPNSAIGNQGAAILTGYIQDTRNMLTSLSLTPSPAVGTADAGAYFNNKVLGAVDYGMANVHPWFANVSAQEAAGWTATFFQTTDVAAANTLPNNPTMYIAETGWPTKSSDAGNASNGPSTASEANLQTFLNTFVCQANTNGTKYFLFEYFDEPWKDVQFGGVEGWWGLFTANRTLKNIQIPNCQAP
ncbi:glycoside hydrolase [Tricholoma matsutake]|nr:glycoside hydrolase [Tricholoma matsutake 945]